jgi:hypothetical protein
MLTTPFWIGDGAEWQCRWCLACKGVFWVAVIGSLGFVGLQHRAIDLRCRCLYTPLSGLSSSSVEPTSVRPQRQLNRGSYSDTT